MIAFIIIDWEESTEREREKAQTRSKEEKERGREKEKNGKSFEKGIETETHKVLLLINWFSLFLSLRERRLSSLLARDTLSLHCPVSLVRTVCLHSSRAVWK